MLADHNKAFLFFIKWEKLRWIDSYQELCQLSLLLRLQGYKTTNPPCSIKDFNNLIEDVRDSLERESKVTHSFPSKERLKILEGELKKDIEEIGEALAGARKLLTSHQDNDDSHGEELQQDDPENNSTSSLQF